LSREALQERVRLAPVAPFRRRPLGADGARVSFLGFGGFLAPFAVADTASAKAAATRRSRNAPRRRDVEAAFHIASRCIGGRCPTRITLLGEAGSRYRGFQTVLARLAAVPFESEA
jgi:hypothetical protein